MIELDVILFFVNFVRTLFFILILYYLIRIINRYVLPVWRGLSGQQQQTRARQNKRPEGDVRIENNRRQESRVPRDEGEYVDFEEID